MSAPGTDVAASTPRARPRRRFWRRLGFGSLGVVLGYFGLVLAGLPIAWIYDYPKNFAFTPDRPDLRAPSEGRHVVVLVHGLLRSSYALGRLERTLESHGYEVHNVDYRSTMATIEQHAEHVAEQLEPVAAAGPVTAWHFVGHSLGGLVIHELLRRRASAYAPTRACVYIATPVRGAMLADLRKRWFPFRWIMGDQAAKQLGRVDPFHDRPIPFVERSGVIVGDIGEGNASLPGNDDGTVRVVEAELPGAAKVVLPLGHTEITTAPRTCEQVLAFLKHGRFEVD